MKSILLQHNEDIKILLEEGDLCKGLSGYLLEQGELFARTDSFRTVYMDTFMRGGNDLRFKKLISVNANQTAPWGGEIRQLIEDLQSLCERDYSVIVMAGSEKTLHYCKRHEGDGLSCESHPKNTFLWRPCVSLTAASVQATDYPDAKTELLRRQSNGFEAQA
jgi:transcription-repair coupling factor (superfamily II helicase)